MDNESMREKTEEAMEQLGGRLSRRDFIRLGGLGVAGLVVGKRLLAPGSAEAVAGPLPLAAVTPAPAVFDQELRLATTDGYIRLPNFLGYVTDPILPQEAPFGGLSGKGLYGFGFMSADPGADINDVVAATKGKVQRSSPTIVATEGDEMVITITNVGLEVRPDLDDSHTIHWHGFRNPTSVFDGVPEVSIAVPPNRDFPYYFNPKDAGTYMYHCHFEDVEHVQMGMSGTVFVRPTLGPKYAYNHPSTAFDREFTLLLNEIDPRPHMLLENIQEFVWSDYKAAFWSINGRAWPHTIVTDAERAALAGTPEVENALPDQPISSLVQANPGDEVLLRMGNLGYEAHVMQLAGGIPMWVVGHDADSLITDTADNSYMTNDIYISPGETRDVIFTAPAYSADGRPSGEDSNGDYNVYHFKNRDLIKLTNGGMVGADGLGGMVTEVRVYDDSPLGAQTGPNETIGNELP